MNLLSLLPRLGGVLAASSLLFLLSGCATEVADASWATASRTETALAAPEALSRSPRARPIKNEYFEVRAGKGAKGGGFAFSRADLSLWAPFRFQTSGGLYSSKGAAQANGGQFCLEVDGRNTRPLQFFGICAQVINNGLNIYAFTSGAGASIGSQFFSGAREADLAIDADGEMMRFLARPGGASSWTTLASIPFSGQNIPLQPAVGASRLSAGARLGLDNMEVISNGDPPPPARTPQEIYLDLLQNALFPLIRAGHNLGSAEADPATALEEITEADTWLERARSSLEDDPFFGTEEQRDAIREELERAMEEINRARAALEERINTRKALKKLKKAVEALIRAIEVVRATQPQ